MNTTIFYFFYNFAHQSNLLDQIIVFFAVYFPYMVILFAVFFLFQNKSWKDFLIVFASSVLAWILAYGLKILIHTARPFVALQNVSALFLENGFAFPSGHATFFSALAMTIFFVNKKVGYRFMFFALLIGLARIMAGVHFPGDILGGFILGSLVSILVSYFLAFFLKNV